MTPRPVHTPSAVLNVLDEGDGPAVVLMHGWSYDLHLWDALVPRLHSIGLRTVRFDHRGHGGSPSTGPYPFDDLVADLAGLTEVLELERPALCGLSLGGFVAMQYAAEHPPAVPALVLADTCPHPIPQDAEMAATIPGTDDGPQALAAWWDARHPVTPATDPVAHRVRRERFLRNDADGLSRAIAACAGRADVTARLASIASPTLVVCGENDAFFPPSLHADLAAAIPAAVLAVIPEAGHIACADRPREFNDTVTDFLSRTLTAADRP
jgi:pimeloyl-ACP methyl ester carboxylesterase